MVIERRIFLAGGAVLGCRPGMARAALPPYRIPIELTERRVLVECTIGGKGPVKLVLDTGGTIGLLRLEVARALKLKQLGTTRLNLQQGHKAYPIFVVPDLTFADQVRQPVSTIAGVDNVGFLDGAVGSIAAGALTAGTCELDFDAAEWRIYRDAAPDRAGWSRYPNAIFPYGNVNGSSFIAAEARLGEASLRFGLDTGMPGVMRVYRKAAEAAGLWDAQRWSPAAPEGRGRMVRAPLGLAGVTLPDTLITMVEDPDWGAFPNGLIGLPILRLFNMATMGAEKTLFLKRNRLAPQPSRYNRAGIWVDQDEAGVKVGVVGAASPAAKAGLAAGDRLVGADLRDLIARLSGPAGSVLSLVVARSGVQRNVTLTLEDFL